MKIILAISLLALLGLTVCTPAQDPSTETWWVNGTTVSCEGAFPMNCLQIQKTDKLALDSWQLFYDQIEGFEPQSGNIYQVKIKITPQSSPIPQDASALNYKLIEIISEYSNESLKPNEFWKITRAYQIKNPVHPFSRKALLFEFDLTKKTYSGNLGCNSVHGQISLNSGPNLKFGIGMSTKMACGDMAIENAVAKGLSETRTYQITKNKMIFFDKNGESLLEFEREN